MRLIVQKYGGSSLSTVEKIRKVAERAVRTRRQGYGVVVVVSAMGHSTDQLLDLARQVGPNRSPRELDALLATGETVSTALLSLAIQNLGQEAISLSANHCGIITNDVHSNARILEVRVERIKNELARGAIVVVPGFLGVTEQQEITTLGRGGSDTTAVALAAALEAEDCVIHTDVDGVYSADPNLVPEAVKIETLGAREMQELAWHGAQVLKAEAVEFANTNGVSVVVRSTFSDNPGTLVHPEPELSEVFRPRRAEVAGVSGRKDIIRITLSRKRSAKSQSREVFAAVSKYDLVFGSISGDGEPIDLFLSNNEIPDAEAFARELKLRFNGNVKVAGNLGAVSLVGFGLGSRPAALLDAGAVLQEQEVPVIKSFTGRESLTFIIPLSRVDDSVRRMHRVFIESRQPPKSEQQTAVQPATGHL